jgi:hypothetical protein
MIALALGDAAAVVERALWQEGAKNVIVTEVS